MIDLKIIAAGKKAGHRDRSGKNHETGTRWPAPNINLYGQTRDLCVRSNKILFF